VIFATCGASHFRFDRMMEALTTLPARDLRVQHGPAKPPACAKSYPYLPFATIIEEVEKADIVVSHAGVGSILCAIRSGHTPVIFPRLRRYSEAVDDHQVELAEALADHGTALIARTPEELAAAVSSVPPRRVVTSSGSRALVDAVRATIGGVPFQVIGTGV
jgi:UDP-N-acetylglucosamine transferase subunit ALG13